MSELYRSGGEAPGHKIRKTDGAVVPEPSQILGKTKEFFSFTVF